VGIMENKTMQKAIIKSGMVFFVLGKQMSLFSAYVLIINMVKD